MKQKFNSLVQTGLAACLLLSVHLPAIAQDSAQATPDCRSGDDAASASGSNQNGGLRTALQADIDTYLEQRAQAEHISAVSLTVSLPGHRPIHVETGTTEYGGKQPIAPDSLWQIGSNTKDFTAATVLQLEAEHMLSIQDTLGKWLPQYPQWKQVTIESMLNMTSGIATYDEQSAFLNAYAAAPESEFTKEQLVGFVKDIPLVTGWNYSNTGYILSQMIIEKVTGDTYENEITKRFVIPLNLRGLYFRTDLYPPAVTERMPAGYFLDNSVPQFAPLLGEDVRRLNLSWAQSAGGIVASTNALTKWLRALYGGCVLPPTQQAELESLISERTGSKITTTSSGDPNGFGLGVQQQYSSSLGIVWDYEGGTFGYRMLHLYLPGPGAIITIGLNSDPPPNEDQIGVLSLSVYNTLHDAGKL